MIYFMPRVKGWNEFRNDSFRVLLSDSLEWKIRYRDFKFDSRGSFRYFGYKEKRGEGVASLIELLGCSNEYAFGNSAERKGHCAQILDALQNDRYEIGTPPRHLELQITSDGKLSGTFEDIPIVAKGGEVSIFNYSYKSLRDKASLRDMYMAMKSHYLPVKRKSNHAAELLQVLKHGYVKVSS